MRIHRPARDRGHFNHGWLDTFHSFSFGHYHDPRWMQFRALRVINDDRVVPGEGFGMHGHKDMEILTYVLEGQLAHRDSLGHEAVIAPGEVQLMTAGTGIRHSEFNPSATEPVHLYQIWLLPDRTGHTPGYEQRRFPAEGRQNRWQIVAGPNANQGGLVIHQDATVAIAVLNPSMHVDWTLAPGRHAWLQVLRGSVNVDGLSLPAGDGLGLSEESRLTVTGTGLIPAEVMLFDLA